MSGPEGARAGPTPPADGGDPVLIRRALWLRAAVLGQRAGYGALAVSVVAFAVALVGDFPGPAVNVVVLGLLAACILLPPAIIAGYAVRAAEREDREAGRLP